ncbi:cytidylyltransferase domain-containing protein [Megasphaera massiliensis]|uniref:cytidylyltransferase domain-containing protein n=1 Tax=Megasphaera massiliensis TaxID=1232428 RepID=UPI001E37A919|nr:hypothetical protein [Megasphaera massiliensis]
MINDKRVLAIIPARGGSKGVPGKNIRMLNGKPLIAWTIEEANKSKYIDRVIVSSDDDAIIKTALDTGGMFLSKDQSTWLKMAHLACYLSFMPLKNCLAMIMWFSCSPLPR